MQKVYVPMVVRRVGTISTVVNKSGTRIDMGGRSTKR